MDEVKEVVVAEWEYRLMSPMGVYPKCEVHTEDASLVVADSVIAIACLGQRAKQDFLNTAILCSSVATSEDLRLYPFPYNHQLLSSSPRADIGQQLSDDIRQKRSTDYAIEGETIPEFDWYENAKGASLPPILNGTPYHFVDTKIDSDVIHQLYQSLKTSICPKLVGASRALNQSNALSGHFQFRAEANGLLLDSLRLMQEVEGFQSERAQLSTLLAQLGDSAEDYLISRQQMSLKITPIEFHRLFVQTCSQLRKHLLCL